MQGVITENKYDLILTSKQVWQTHTDYNQKLYLIVVVWTV